MLLLDKRDFRPRDFIFINTSGKEKADTANPTFAIQINDYPAEDLIRYCTKLYYSKNIPVDYNKVIKLALDFYFKNHIGEKELKEIEDMKKEEARIIKEAMKKEIPKFNWDKGNK